MTIQRSKNFPDCFHRVTIKGLYVKDGKVLLVREGKELSGEWEMPGGGLDFGEDIREGFTREIKEEMGLEIVKMSKSPMYAWTHRYEEERDMDWYYSLVVAYRIEFKNLDFTPTQECESIGFFSREELKNIPLVGQTNELAQIFNPEDFEKPF